MINAIEGWGQAVLAADFRSLNGGSRVDLKNRFIKAKLLSNILRMFGLGDIRDDARNNVIITPPKDLSKRLRETIATVWGYRGAMKKSPIEILSFLLRSIGVKLKRKSKRQGDSFSTAYWIDPDSVSWSVEVTRHHVEMSRRDRREEIKRVEVEDLFPGSPSIDLEEIQALMMMECAA
ncbi:MAG: hypothetical protein R3A79_07920 [Nannocystaceae bacterium]